MISTSYTTSRIHLNLPVESDCIPKLNIKSRIQKLFTVKVLKKHSYSLLTLREHHIEISNNSIIQPIGIKNFSRNCWCITALQILCNTPIGLEMANSTKFSKDFPEIKKFMELYRKTLISPQLLGKRIQHIRKELHEKISYNFSKKQSRPADATEFLNLLINRYALGQEFKFCCHSKNLPALLATARGKHLFIETTPLPPELNLHNLFTSTPYELLGFIFYIAPTKHYIVSVKVDGIWYKCDDKIITILDRKDLILRKNIVLIIASQKYLPFS